MSVGLTGATVVGVLGPAPAHAAASSVSDPDQPLVPRIRSISPDYVPDKGPIIIRGTLTNVSDQTWTAINVHGFMGSTALTTEKELSAATETPVDADVGARILTPGTFDSIDELTPGESTTFKVRLPRSTLPVSSPGVYWFGVHVLGDNGEGGTRSAVGRDRTFIPYVPQDAVPDGGHEDASLVLPLRAGVTRAADGSVLDPDVWGRSLRSGPLYAAVRTAQAAQNRPLTWLLDPAVPDVVRRLAHGNPARTLNAPPKSGNQNPSSPASPSASSSASESGAAGTAPDPATAKLARQWLHALRPLLATDTSELLGLPYGDVAVESAARSGGTLLGDAIRRTGRSLHPWGVPLNPVVAPPDGRTTGPTLADLPHDTDVLLSDSGVDDASSVVNRVDGHHVVLTSSAALQGGPGPAPAHSSLALRQRVLAEAAIRVIDDQQPLVVELPAQLHHPLHRSFFSGLEVPWLRLTTLAGATAATPTPLDDTALREPSPDEPQLGQRVYDAAGDALTAGATLQSVLTGNHVLRKRLFAEVTGNASYAASATPFLALDRMRATDAWVHSNLNAIQIAAPQSVTLAANSGRFSAIVSNELDVPVTVGVRALAERGLKITGGTPFQLAPHARTPVFLHASTDERGVYNVRLELTTADGKPLGRADTFPMRAEQVSKLIWVIIGVGLALLFAAIAIRLTRRVIASRAGRGAL
jgi:hypothetical protein